MFHSVVLLDDGCIVVIGGFICEFEVSIYGVNNTIDVEVEIFDLVFLMWFIYELFLLKGYLIVFHKVVHLGGSKVVLVGGVCCV